MNSIFYMIGCAETEKGGIYRYEMTSGTDFQLLDFQQLDGSNYLCYSPDGKNFYATINREKQGGLAAYSMGPDGKLTFLNEIKTQGSAACHLNCSPDRKFIYCVNYSTGNFAEVSLKEDGSLGEITQLIQHTGRGPRDDRQLGPHTHCCVFTPDQKWLCIVDLGVDSIFLYPFVPGKGIVNKPNRCKFQPADGPRHILFDAGGKFAYVANELGNSVTALSYADGVLTPLKTWTTLPAGCTATTKASAIRFSPDGKRLFVSNRGYDSIACYNIVRPGELELYDIVMSNGKSPRDINFLPGGKIFAAANEFSDCVTFYNYDAETGKLEWQESRTLRTMPRPLCIM